MHKWQKATIRVMLLLGLALLLLQNKRFRSEVEEKSLSSSVVGMDFLLEKEHQLLLAMENYGNKLENKLNIIRGVIIEMWTENLKYQINPEEYLPNHINNYAFIRRLHQYWAKWELFLSSSIGEEEIREIKRLLIDVPNSVDLIEASEAIYRLNFIYDIKPADMATGLLNGKQYDARFSAIECFSIGYRMFQNHRYDFSEIWLNTSLQLYQDSDINAVLEFDKIKIFDLYAKVLLKQNRSVEALGIIENALNLNPLATNLLRTISEIDFKDRTESEAVPETTEQVPEDEYATDMAWLKHICHQYNYQSKLHCLYNKTTSAFLQLAPLKMEILNLEPYVVLYHDVISDAEIAALKIEAGNVFRTAKNYFVLSKERTVKAHWILNSNNIINRLEQRITDMSGFDLKDSESIQIMNYGMGGHYFAHSELLDETEVDYQFSELGHRIATVLFYLSDVEHGGATAFPLIPIRVYPKKGAALMWYNLDIKGQAHPESEHGSCPVIVGSKWGKLYNISSVLDVGRQDCYGQTFSLLLISRLMLLLGLALLLLQSVRCQSDVGERSLSTSVVGMEFLLVKEHQLLLAMENYGNKLENKLNIIRGAITEMRTENLKSQINPEEYLSNPINSYALIRRLHQDWANWELFLRSSVGEVEISRIKGLLIDMPTSVDLMEASEAIYRLNVIYDIKPPDMASGLLYGKQYDARFSAIDCFSIGYLMFQDHKYNLSEIWLNTSLQMYQNSDINAVLEFDKIKILDLYAKVLLKQNRLVEALEMIQIALNLNPLATNLLRTKSEIEFKAQTQSETVAETTEQVPEDDNELDMAWLKQFCHQYDYQSKLHCLYNKTTSAFLQLAPLKMEILNLAPYIILYHDVISDAEIAALKIEAGNKLERAENVYQVSKIRTVKGHFIMDSNNIIDRIEQRITDMSGFDLWDSESIQVMNYGMGGHYGMHVDYLSETDDRDEFSKFGDRIATALFYLSDVEQGGATTFPYIPIVVYPKKGTALIWYNTDIKGKADPETMHAACPVIVGSKWVFAKWIRQYSQMFRRRCYA